MPRAQRVRCRVLYPVSVSVSLQYWSAVPMVASWPSLLTWFPVAAGSSAAPVGASKPYSWCKCEPFLGLAPSVPTVFLCRVPELSPTAAVPRCGSGSAAVPGPPLLSSSQPLIAHTLVSWVVGGFLTPPRPCLFSPVSPSPLVAILGVSSPQGNSATPGVSMPCGNLTPPRTPFYRQS